MNGDFEARVYESNAMVTIEINGDLTSSAEKTMDEIYEKVWDYNPNSIMLRFSKESRINSAGIAILITLLCQSQKKGCRIFVSGLSEHLRYVFDLVGLTEYATIVDPEDQSI